MEVTAAVIAIKVAKPTITRREVHELLKANGAQCTLSAVKKVRVGCGSANDRERDRAAKFEHARQVARALDRYKQSVDIGQRLSASATTHDLESSKATQGMIEVNTQLGKRVYLNHSMQQPTPYPTPSRRLLVVHVLQSQWCDAHCHFPQ